MLSVERRVARLLLPYRPWSCVDLARLQVDFQLLKSEPSPVLAPTGSRGDGFEGRVSDPRADGLTNYQRRPPVRRHGSTDAPPGFRFLGWEGRCAICGCASCAPHASVAVRFAYEQGLAGVRNRLEGAYG
jgi:hypothetical protein